ncbi:hypothetical protein AGMMS49525_07650 [Bacteroidia bacterium]|nr:hypothetical protein AGMMS49525_07650 [Bacteroidia bacterium]
MGTIKQGVLGGFSGKVGTVIGSHWKGINYMRGIPQHVHNPRTEGQVNQRTKFAVALHFLQPLNDFLRTGFKLYAKKQLPFNAAKAYTLANAITGTSPLDYAIDQSKVLVSRGRLPLPDYTEADTGPADFEVNFHWSNNSGLGSAQATDKALLVLFNFGKAEVLSITAGNPRSAERQQMFAPEQWQGDDVYAYIGFISEDGKQVSNSKYLGICEIP